MMIYVAGLYLDIIINLSPCIKLLELSIRLDPEQFSSDGVTVNLEWTLLNSQTYYQQLLRNIIVNAAPPPRNIIFTGNMRAQLVLAYNTPYNVSVTQNSTCEQLIQTSFLELNYGKLCMHIVNSIIEHELFLQPSVLTQWN